MICEEKKKDCRTHGAVAGGNTVLGMAEGALELIRKESTDLPTTPDTGTARRTPPDRYLAPKSHQKAVIPAHLWHG